MSPASVAVEIRLAGGHVQVASMTPDQAEALRDALARDEFASLPDIVAVDTGSNFRTTETSTTRHLLRSSAVVSMTFVERTMERVSR